MRFSSHSLVVAVAGALFFAPALADPTSTSSPYQTPTSQPLPNQRTSQGCFHNGGNMTQVPVKDMSSGACNDVCKSKNYWVTGLHAASCYCGYAYPPKDSLVSDSDCNYACPNYPPEACGGLGDPGYYSIFNTGINVNVIYYDPPASSSTTSSAPATTSKTIAASRTPTAPAAAETTTSAPEKKSGTNVAAVAAGVVSGVVVIAALIGGGFFYMRRKRNAEMEEEYRRNAAVNAFISGSKPPSSSGSISMTDSRLDPVLARHRLSDGSIADNQDYSRRILRVTNA